MSSAYPNEVDLKGSICGTPPIGEECYQHKEHDKPGDEPILFYRL